MRKILRNYLQFLKRPNYNNKISGIPTRYSNVLGAKGGSCGMQTGHWQQCFSSRLWPP